MSRHDRPKIITSDWRALSVGISEEMRAGFDLGGLDLPSDELGSYFQLPDDFRVHKVGGVPYVTWTAIALALYGEWGCAAAGLSPLGKFPLAEMRVPNESVFRRAAAGVWVLAERCGRADDAARLEPLTLRPEGHSLNEHALSGGILQRFLDMSEDEHADYFDGHEPHAVARRYVADIGSLGLIWAQGASETFTRGDCEREIDRYARAIFALPGFAPWNDRAYPYEDTQKMEAE